MNKTKKLLSLLAAAAISATAFAGLAVTAGAATDVYVSDFSSGTDNWQVQQNADGTTGNYNATIENTDGYLKILCPDKRDRAAYYTPTETKSDYMALDFDIFFAAGNTNATRFRVLSTTTDKGNNTTGGKGNGTDIFTLSMPKDGGEDKITVNDSQKFDITKSTDKNLHPYKKWYGTSPWLTVKTIFNFTNYTVQYTVSEQGKSEVIASDTVDMLNKDTKPEMIKRLYVTAGQYLSGVYLKNISLKTLVYPQYTLKDSQEATLTSDSVVKVAATAAAETSDVKNTAEVTVDVTGNSVETVEAVSSNPEYATATYSEGKITVTGKEAGDQQRVTVTVTATSADGLQNEQTFLVDIGTVATYDVTINYYKLDGATKTTTKVAESDTTTYAAQSAGTKITSVPYETEIENNEKTIKYKYNSMVPAVSKDNIFKVSTTAADNVINVYYTEHADAGDLTVNYIAGGETIGSKTWETEITEGDNTINLYEGDSFTYNYPAYVKGNDGSYYKAKTTAYVKTVALTKDMTEEVEYEKADSVVAFVEGEAGSASRSAEINSSELYSEGKAVTISGSSGYVSYSVVIPETAEYKLIIGQGARASTGGGSSYSASITDGNAVLGSVAGVKEGATVGEITAPLAEGTHTIYARIINNALSPIDYIAIEKTGTAEEATVTINDNGTITTAKAAVGGQHTLPAAAGKDDYTFIGWSLDGVTTYATGAAVNVTGDVTYKAIYALSQDATVGTTAAGTGENAPDEEAWSSLTAEGFGDDYNDKLATPITASFENLGSTYANPKINWEITYKDSESAGETKRSKTVTYTGADISESTTFAVVIKGADFSKLFSSSAKAYIWE